MIYKIGDFIGQKYEVYGVLGSGGFGVVYLVYSHETESVYALKTFRDEYLQDLNARERFRKEANAWVDLERHPYIVRAFFVEEINHRLYIVMEYIAPDDKGLNTLDHYLKRRPPDLAQTVRWSIQFCHGMEYACSKGIRCHRDIKAINILISQDKTVKITDFGLAGILGHSKAVTGIKLSLHDGSIGLSGQTMEGVGFGTPTHMPPEQFTNAAECDERSDVYSFGVVLYQMRTAGQLPFLAPLPRDSSEEEARRFWRAMYELHSESPVPKLNSPLDPIIERCLAKEPDKRYRSFQELRSEMESLLRGLTGEVVTPPELKDLEAWEWSNKGISLATLGRFDEALDCFDKALEFDPRDAEIWNNKGTCLSSVCRFEESIRCYDNALEFNPKDAAAWTGKGNTLKSAGLFLESASCFEEAIGCYDRALALDLRHADAWYSKAMALDRLGQFDEALSCFDKALELDPRDPASWNKKGVSLEELGRLDEALRCYDRAVELDPQYPEAWINKALAEGKLGRTQDYARSLEQYVNLPPRRVGSR